jgi:hypothetical protein
MSWANSKYYKTFFLFASSREIDALLNEIQYELDNISITKNAFERIKKVWVANEIKAVDNIERIAENMYDDIVNYDDIVSDRINAIKRMNIGTINNLIKAIDFKNRSYVKMVEKKEED